MAPCLGSWKRKVSGSEWLPAWPWGGREQLPDRAVGARRKGWGLVALAASVPSSQCLRGPLGRRSKKEGEGVERDGHLLLSPFPPPTSRFLDFIEANFTECKEVLDNLCSAGRMAGKSAPPSRICLQVFCPCTSRDYKNTHQSPLIKQNLIYARASHFL